MVNKCLLRNLVSHLLGKIYTFRAEQIYKNEK